MDRIDIWIEVPRIAHDALSEKRVESRAASDAAISAVQSARERQRARFDGIRPTLRKNADMTVRDIDTMIELSPAVAKILNDSAKRLDLSPRSYHRIIKLARTFADIASADEISDVHILEALQYRPKNLM
ncbi:MAG TPA: ATP-binding protein [Candidatus Paceibacterota bacterium]|nr:ATP-binding protein [Candidatus Paceibacterota bacterium]